MRLSAGSIAAGGHSEFSFRHRSVIGWACCRRSCDDLFAAAIVPGLLLSGLYIVYTLTRCYINPKLGPPLPLEDREKIAVVVKELLLGVAPVVVIILATLGVILAGIATPTDAGAVGAFAVLALTLVYRRLTWQKLKSAVFSTLLVSE